MNPNLVGLLPLAFFVLASFPRAQLNIPPAPWDDGSPCLPYDPQNSIVWPTNPDFGTPAGFGRIVLADLDGDQATDGVALADGVAVVLWNLAVHDAPQRILFETESAPVDVTDVAILPGHGPSGQDSLVMSDERGLYVVTFANGSFGDPEPLEGLPLAFAHSIHVDDLDNDTELDILALAADQRSVYMSVNDAGLFTTSFVVFEPYLTFDVVAVNWDQQGGRELVALTKRGLVVHDFAGTYLGGSVHHATSGCITRLHTGGLEGGEIVAWTRPTVGGPSQLVLKSATITEGPWPLTFDICGTPSNIHPSALLAGKYDADQNDELLLAHEGGPTAIVLANIGASEPPPVGQAAGPHFDVEDPLAYDILALSEFSTAGGGIGIPAFDQVDGIDSDDIVFPVSSTGQVEVFLFYPFVRAIMGSGITSAEVISEYTEFGPELGVNRLRLAFVVPDRFLNHTHVEVIAWYQPDAPGAVWSQALGHTRHALLREEGSVFPATQWVEVVPSFPDSDSSEGICWNEFSPAPKPNFYTQIRFAKDIGGGVFLKSPIYTGGFTLEDCDESTSYGYLIFRGIIGADFDLHEDNGLRDTEAMPMIDRIQVGLYVPMSSQPPFDEDDPPVAGTPTPGPTAHAFHFQ